MRTRALIAAALIITSCSHPQETASQTLGGAQSVNPEVEEQLQHFSSEESSYAPLGFSISYDPWSDTMGGVPFTTRGCGSHSFLVDGLKGQWLYCDAVFDVRGVELSCPFVMFLLEGRDEVSLEFLPGDFTSSSCDVLMPPYEAEFIENLYLPLDFAVSTSPLEGELEGHSFVAEGCLGHSFQAGDQFGSWVFCETRWGGEDFTCPLLFLFRNGSMMAAFLPTEDLPQECLDAGPEMPVVIDDPSGIFKPVKTQSQSTALGPI